MKKLISFLLFLLFCVSVLPALSAQAAPAFCDTLSAECAVLVDAENRRVLYGKDADKRHAMASTTKIMTALVALEHAPLDRVITVPEEAVGVEGSSVYLRAGERYTLEALLHALMLASANDAAEVIAHAIAGSTAAFAELMNEKAATLGLTDTHFENPHGLDSDGHYTTARELALIACEALENPDFERIVSTRRYVFSGIDGENVRTLINHNKMLFLYDGAIGVKTGFTKRCGRCLVSAAKRDGMTLIAVTLDAPSDWSDHAKLLDHGYGSYESRRIAAPGEVSCTVPMFNTDTEITVKNRDEIRLVLEKGAPTPSPEYDMGDWVLSKFTQDEQKILFDRFETVLQGIEKIVKGDVDGAMLLCNTNNKGNTD